MESICSVCHLKQLYIYTGPGKLVCAECRLRAEVATLKQQAADTEKRLDDAEALMREAVKAICSIYGSSCDTDDVKDRIKQYFEAAQSAVDEGSEG